MASSYARFGPKPLNLDGNCDYRHCAGIPVSPSAQRQQAHCGMLHCGMTTCLIIASAAAANLQYCFWMPYCEL